VVVVTLLNVLRVQKTALKNLEIQTSIKLDAKVFTVSALCLLKTHFDVTHKDGGTNSALDLCSEAASLTAQTLSEAGINTRIYDLVSIQKALYQLFLNKEK